MTKLAIVFGAAISLSAFGCKKGRGADEAIAKMTQFKDAMCKCAEGDAACAKKVQDDMMKATEEKGKGDKDAKPDPEVEKKLAAIAEELGKCTTRAITPKGGAAPAAAPGGEAKPDDKKDEKKESSGW
jgi:hypothetical protein